MRLLILVPFLIALVLFALSNRHPVALGFWPTDFLLDVPVSLAVLGAAAIAFLVGALLVWIGELGQRRRARLAEIRAEHLQEEVRSLQARLQRSTMPAPATIAAPPIA